MPLLFLLLCCLMLHADAGDFLLLSNVEGSNCIMVYSSKRRIDPELVCALLLSPELKAILLKAPGTLTQVH